jgi:putative transposase
VGALNDKKRKDRVMPGNRKSIRLKDYDYTQAGAYYVTVCVNNRKCMFGDVHNGEMVLNEYGEMADKCWNQISQHFPHVELDECIIMPNHLHGIINITPNVGAGFPRPDNDKGRGNRAPTLGQIIAYFKYGSTKQINQLRDTPRKPVWQRNFYEHVIRDESGLNRIREYIVNNPAQWEKDEYYAQYGIINITRNVGAGLPRPDNDKGFPRPSKRE